MDEVDRILANEPVVRPSEGFAAGVMETVRHEAETPPPIEFPWARFLPGFFICIGLIFATFMVLGWTGGAGMTTSPAAPIDPRDLLAVVDTPRGHALGLAAAAILGSLLLVGWALRSAGRSDTSPTI